MNDIVCNPFVFRQTKFSRYSYFDGSWSELEALVKRHFSIAVKIEPDGLRLKVTLPQEACRRFFSAVCLLDEHSQVQAIFAARSEGEQPYLQHSVVNGVKTRAEHVDIILYHRSILTLEEKSYFPDGASEAVIVENEWQIISVNARATAEEEPLTPQAMARNEAARLGLPEGAGGTTRAYTAEEYMRSILYWSRRAMAEGG